MRKTKSVITIIITDFVSMLIYYLGCIYDFPTLSSGAHSKESRDVVLRLAGNQQLAGNGEFLLRRDTYLEKESGKKIYLTEYKDKQNLSLLIGLDGWIYLTCKSCSSIFAFQILGPVMCTDSPRESTATVTGMSFTSNS